MACTNAFSVHAVLHLVHPIGGTRMNIWALRRWCRLIGGSLILELVPVPPSRHFPCYVQPEHISNHLYSCRIHMAPSGRRNFRMSWACTDVTQSLTVRCYLILWINSTDYLFLAIFLQPVMITWQLGSKTCPKGLNPAAAIAKLKLELAAEWFG